MLFLRNEDLVFSYPKVHIAASLRVTFQRTLRIPDDGETYPLPPGLDKFPMVHVDDHDKTIKSEWLEPGGVMLPMYQSEAMWVNFSCKTSLEGVEYPFAIKIAVGKINAVSGEEWSEGLNTPQDYMVAPRQWWLDGFNTGQDIIRQFVAMPLGEGYSAEEQLTGKSECGGLQIEVFPMKRELFDQWKESQKRKQLRTIQCCMSTSCQQEVGIAAGGRMRQEIYDDPHGLDVWDLDNGSRCFVRLVNSLAWRNITGQEPPTTPLTSKEYERAGLPWFEYYDDEADALPGSEKLAGLKSVAQIGEDKGDIPLPENEPVTPQPVVTLQKAPVSDQVREGKF